jgi:hypothetical protein
MHGIRRPRMAIDPQARVEKCYGARNPCPGLPMTSDGCNLFYLTPHKRELCFGGFRKLSCCCRRSMQDFLAADHL